MQTKPSIPFRNKRLSAGLLLFLCGALLLSIGAPWASQFRDQIKGGNTAPLYLRISGDLDKILPQDLASRFFANSTSTGNTAHSEVVSATGHEAILRWRWVLVSDLRFAPSLEWKEETVQKIEYAYDPACGNEIEAIPDALVWRTIPLPEISDTTGPDVRLDLPALSKSLVPRPSISKALNWGGDSRALSRSFPGRKLPWSACLFASLLLTGLPLFLAGLRPPAPTPTVPHGIDPEIGNVAGGTSLLLYWPSLVIFGIFSLLALSASPVFDVNDDQRMIALLAGHWQLPAGPRALFMSVTLGWPLHLLYGLAPTVPWYGLMLESGLLAALFAVGVGGTRFLSPLGHAIGFTVFLVFAGFVPAVRITFSLVAVVACVSGAFCLLSFVLCPASGKRRRSESFLLVVSILLLAFSASLRFEAFTVALAAISPTAIFLPSLLRDRARRPTALRVAAALGIALALVLAGRVTEQIAYASAPEWADWKERNDARAKALDWSAPSKTPATAGQVNLSHHDLKMLSHHFLLDSRLVDEEVIAPLAEQARSTRKQLLSSISGIYENANRILSRLPDVDPPYGNPLLLGLFTVGTGLLALLFEKDRRFRTLPLFALFWTLTLLVALALLTKPVPYRISYGMLFPAAIIAWLGVGRIVERTHRTNRVRFGLVSAALLLATAFASAHHGGEIPQRRERAMELANEMNELARSEEQDAVLHYLPSYAFPALSPHPQFGPVRIHDTGYLSTTPPAARSRHVSGFTDLPDLLGKRNRVLFLAANPGHTIYGSGASEEDLELYLGERLEGDMAISVERENFHWRWLSLDTGSSDH